MLFSLKAAQIIRNAVAYQWLIANAMISNAKCAKQYAKFAKQYAKFAKQLQSMLMRIVLQSNANLMQF